MIIWCENCPQLYLQNPESWQAWKITFGPISRVATLLSAAAGIFFLRISAAALAHAHELLNGGVGPEL
jgi:hypothetical protein